MSQAAKAYKSFAELKTQNPHLRLVTEPPMELRGVHRTTIEFAVEDCDLPALKSAVDEISNTVGGRLVSPHSFPREHALTSAVSALGALRAAINRVVKQGDSRYAA